MIIHFFGLIGMILIVSSIQMKNKDKYLLLQLLGNIAFVINFVMLEAYSGALISTIIGTQALTILLYLKNNKEAPNIVIYTFISIVLISAFILVRNVIDLLPILAALTMLFIFLQKQEKNIRKLSITISLLWIPYAIYFNAYFAIATNVIFLISNIISIIRYDFKK